MEIIHSPRKAPDVTAVLMRDRILYYCWRLALPFAVVAAVWIPHFSHYRIDRSPVSWEAAQASAQAPTPAVLDEISGQALGARFGIPDEKILGIAEQILVGTLAVPSFLEAPMALQGYPIDYQRGSSSLQLVMASLEVERVLLSAFEQAHDRRFLDLATRRVLDFAAHEAGQRQGDGFLWNDHAVAGRISVLAKLWRLVRESPELPIASSRQILSLVERSGRLLAKPTQFTVRTNHGVAQNLALLQIAAAFPALPESGAWRRLAVQRLNVQLPFYVSREGVILEHSANYHLFGTELLTMAVRLSVLNGLKPEPSLVDAARTSRQVLARLMRPDGTLPVLGNTVAGGGSAIPIADSGGTGPIQHQWPPHPNPVIGGNLFPVAGYAIWWQANESKQLSQTLIAWAKHDGHGHKHADEGSVLFWSGGVDWLTNTGYWPYGARNEEAAYSWTGSNAPHQPGEEFLVPRSVQLLKTGEASGVSFIEVERRNTDGAQFRRQVLQIDAQTLLVLDFAQGVPKGIETIWTVDPTLRLSPGATASNFISTPVPDGRHLMISHTAARVQIRRGSERPFAGWVVVDGRPTQADALQIVDPASNSASAILFRVASGSMDAAQKISIETGATADHWAVLVEGAGELKRVSRQDTTITMGHVANSTNPTDSLLVPLRPAPDVAVEIAALTRAYANAVKTYPPWRELTRYRLRLSYALAILALLVELGWFAISKLAGVVTRRQFFYAHLGMTLCWAAIAVWIVQFYLR
ncbi:heparinase II/III family protein [Rhodoferax ferrireducens]|uniref:heparinase II/III domain-containing protein n=1 Tax=Rhodoferax ferrireducens TaxID=192843 RepID=UPI00298E4FB8|nr:heparinase II/III family protein [Rhodoferax ferrireducens]WPC67653.1 heparinase II/III family protein [Rhodoferax ferrireducens]